MKNFFDSTPVVSKHITTEMENGCAVIVFPRFRSKFMQRHFVPKNKSPYIRIRLEKHGTAVWNLIDGKRSVRNISEALAGHFNSEANYEYRVAAYLKQLQRQGFVQ
ncbi:MAG: PqqD family protein [Bacteroidales bacterium]|jgi:hypothetical protein|nr:PqqD family protein [Bacteroidales bacterium]